MWSQSFLRNPKVVVDEPFMIAVHPANTIEQMVVHHLVCISAELSAPLESSNIGIVFSETATHASCIKSPKAG